MEPTTVVVTSIRNMQRKKKLPNRQRSVLSGVGQALEDPVSKDQKLKSEKKSTSLFSFHSSSSCGQRNDA